MSNTTIQDVAPQIARKEAQKAGKKKASSSLLRCTKDDIIRSREAGHDVYRLSEEHQCKEFLVLQLDVTALRAQVRELGRLREEISNLRQILKGVA